MVKRFITNQLNVNALLSEGVRYMLIATFSFASMHAIVKSLEGYHVFEIMFFRSVITALFCTLYLKRKQISLIAKKQKLLILRSFFGMISMVFFFITLQQMPIGASVSIKYLSPVFSSIFALFLLKEKARIIQWVLFFFTLGGILLLKGFDTRIDTLNLVLGLLGAICGGLVYVVIRKIGSTEHSMVIINYFMLSVTLISGLAMVPFWITPTLWEWGMLTLMGIFGYFGQVFMTKSLQVEKVNRVAPVKYMEIVYSLMIGFFWFDENYTALGFLGIVIIIFSMVLNIKSSKKHHEIL